MTDAEAENEGRKAEQAMLVLGPAMDQVKVAIMQELVRTSPSMPDKILTLHRAAQNVDATRQAIMDVVNNGKIAAVAIANAGLTRNS
jgi:hypothetical protein